MSDMLSRLRALKEAHAEGLIDNDEFAAAKQEVLKGPSAAAPAPVAAAPAPVAAAPAPVAAVQQPPARKSPRLQAAEHDQEVKQPAKKKPKPKGKKPLQDFEVGKSYPGVVVSTTPFGAFIDIDCHSQGLCHISRLSDDFVKDVSDVVEVGQKVTARVTEIDTKKKTLTLSMQSEELKQKEQASIQAKRERDELGADAPKKPRKEQSPDEETPKRTNRNKKRGSDAQARRNKKRLEKRGRGAEIA